MAMLMETYVDRVFLRVGQGASQDQVGLYRKTIEAQVLDALQELADRTAKSVNPDNSPNYGDRALIQKIYSIAMAGGTAALGVGGSADIMADYIQYVIHPNAPGGKPMQPLPLYTDLLSPKGNALYYYYTVTANAIFGMKGDGKTLPEDATLSVQANFIPSLTWTTSTVPPKKEPDLVSVGIELAMRKLLPDQISQPANMGMGG